MMDKQYLTQERLDELKQQLQELRTKKRAEVADRLKRAKELGDLSENSEYFEARDEQVEVESKIAEIEDIVKSAAIIQKTGATGSVQIGSTFVVAKDGKEFKFTLVGSNEARPEAGLISNESPLGKAFFSKKAGDVVKVKTPAGEMTYNIISVE